MSLWFFSDPHLGVNRSSHTTAASRDRLKQEVFNYANKAIWHAEEGEPVFCLGDLFDNTFNDEATIAQGLYIGKQCKAVLAGNHDLPNREGRISSLDLLQDAGVNVIKGSTDEPGFHVEHEALADVYFVPHMATQDLFEQSLNEVINAAQRDRSRPTILCLHCNYNSGLIANDASLNLTAEWADYLLETFDYVLLGHEHHARTLHGGRLIVLGNTFPTSFGDLSTKWVWSFNGKNMVQHILWDMPSGRVVMPWEELNPYLPDGTQFVSIEGEAKLEDMPSIASNISVLWKDNPQLLMVRNNVTCEALAPVEIATHKHLDLPSRITAALTDPDMAALWAYYLETAQ